MLRFITDKLAEWQASRQQREYALHRAAAERETQQRRSQFERLAHTTFAEHIKECQEHSFERGLKRDGVPVWIRNSFDPVDGVKETEIIVVMLSTREAFVIVFSRLAVSIDARWRTFTDLETSPLQFHRKVWLEGRIPWQLIPLRKSSGI